MHSRHPWLLEFSHMPAEELAEAYNAACRLFVDEKRKSFHEYARQRANCARSVAEYRGIKLERKHGL